MIDKNKFDYEFRIINNTIRFIKINKLTRKKHYYKLVKVDSKKHKCYICNKTNYAYITKQNFTNSCFCVECVDKFLEQNDIILNDIEF